MTDKTREDFEAWVTKQGHAAGYGGDGVYDVWVVSRWWESWQAATQQSAARIAALEAERAEFLDASKVNLENYEFQRRKADAATATVYQFHYAMKDAGWHPGRTDDNLCDIIRAKGAELAKLEAEVLALRERAVPSGCVVVPKEPTAEMLAAAAHISVCREDVYKAMIDAGQIITTPEGVAEWAQRLAIEAERGEG